MRRHKKKHFSSLSLSFSHLSTNMSAVDVAFKITCGTLFATALASGAWLTASMVKGYNDAQEYQVKKVEERRRYQSIGHDDDDDDDDVGRPPLTNLDLLNSLIPKKKKKKKSGHTRRPPNKQTHPQPRRLERLLDLFCEKKNCNTEFSILFCVFFFLFLSFLSFFFSPSLFLSLLSFN